MPEYFHVASIVLVTDQNKLIFQKRDNKPGVRNPGMVTVWGGAVESGETVVQAAVREMAEETNLRPEPDDLESFGDYERDYRIDDKPVMCHVFLLRGVDDRRLEVYEGEGYVVVDPELEPADELFAELTIMLIRDFNNKLDQGDGNN